MTNDFALLQVKKNILLDELNKYLSGWDITPSVQESILDQCINTNLYMFILSDFRDHLALSDLITRNNQLKKKTPITDITTLLSNQSISEDILNWNKILYKNRANLVVDAIGLQYNSLKEPIAWLMKVSTLSVIFYFATLSMQKKMNVSGIIRQLEKEKKIIYKQLPSAVIVPIKELTADNRKRTKEYYRGKDNSKDYFAIYYPIAIVCIIVFAYLYYYFNLFSANG